MPGPVSDSYDPEFGTSYNAEIVHEAITNVRDMISDYIGNDVLRNIVELSIQHNDPDSKPKNNRFLFNEVELRIIRFCMNRVLEDI
jgi:hypothetical protein